jgi:hypothetical protein
MPNKTNVNIRVGTNQGKKEYQGNNKIFYVYVFDSPTPTYSGTLEMCQKYIESTGRLSRSLDHRPFRPEFKK